MGDIAKEKLKQKHIHVYNCNILLHKIGCIMSIFVEIYMYGVAQNEVNPILVATLRPYIPFYSIFSP
jgi:hypothetical protein